MREDALLPPFVRTKRFGRKTSTFTPGMTSPPPSKTDLLSHFDSSAGFETLVPTLLRRIFRPLLSRRVCFYFLVAVDLVETCVCLFVFRLLLIRVLSPQQPQIVSASKTQHGPARPRTLPHFQTPHLVQRLYCYLMKRDVCVWN